MRVQYPLLKQLELLTWVSSSKCNLIVLISKKLLKSEFLSVLHNILWRVRPCHKQIIKSCAFALVGLMVDHSCYLLHLSSYDLIHDCASLLPTEFSEGFNKDNREHYILRILQQEFRLLALDAIKSKPYNQLRLRKNERCKAKMERVVVNDLHRQSVVDNWPQKVDNKVILECLSNYRKSYIWKPPKICCVCGLERHSIGQFDILRVGKSPISFDVLRCDEKDDFLHLQCEFNNNFLNGALLDIKGFVTTGTGEYDTVQLCGECHSSLNRKQMPKFSLANKLYRGNLPEEFRDITGIEEMVCAIYRNTAHVTRLYQSDDPAQPRVFHGNTCAHEMNIVSTVSILPHTLSDINDLLSMVFIGPGKFKPEDLDGVF